jgi:hypothetical protein
MTTWHYYIDPELVQMATLVSHEGVEVTEIFHPEIPWECWREKPIDPQKAWEAVRAMCGG